MSQLGAAAALAIALAACGDNLAPAAPDAPARVSCTGLLPRTVERPDVGECLVDGVDLLVPGVSYRSSDGRHTWIQRVIELDGDVGALVRASPWDSACEWHPCLVERTPATGEP